MSEANLCMAEARAQVRGRGPGWIGKTVQIIQHHNAKIKHDKVCGLCDSASEILWEPPGDGRVVVPDES